MGILNYMDNHGICSGCGKPILGTKVIYLQGYNSEKGAFCEDCIRAVVRYKRFIGESVSDSLQSMLKTFEFMEDDMDSGLDVCADEKNLRKSQPRKLLRPVEIKERLDQYVVGQEEAKKTLAVSVYNHYKRLELNDRSIKKANILMIGPTGCGKTYLLETLAKEILDVPIVTADATSLTEAGYIGDDVESIISRLLAEAGGDVSKTERGIVFLDEVDKLAIKKSSTEYHVGGKGVQQALLKILEGDKVTVPVMTAGRKEFGRGNLTATINTDNILFICGGAFPELRRIIENRLQKKNGIGFMSSVNPEPEMENTLSLVCQEDLKKFGMIPEFLGRLPIITVLDELDTATLKRVLSEPKNSLVEQYKKLMAYDNVRLTFSDDGLEEIAVRAKHIGTGARALRSIMEKVLSSLMFYIPEESGEKEAVITGEYVRSALDGEAG